MFAAQKKERKKERKTWSVLGTKRRGADVEEGSLALSRHGLGQHRLARPWRTEHKDAFPGPPDALEIVGHPEGQNNSLLQELLRFIQIGHFIPSHVHATVENLAFYALD